MKKVGIHTFSRIYFSGDNLFPERICKIQLKSIRRACYYKQFGIKINSKCQFLVKLLQKLCIFMRINNDVKKLENRVNIVML